MESRLFDFLYVMALVLLCFSSGGLMLYAIWNIGMQVMRAIHILLTCWDYQKGSDFQRRLLLGDPVMRGILTLTSPFQHFCPLPIRRLSRLRRLEEYRFARLRRQNADLVWDPRLAALLTRDEYEHLYASEPE